MPSDETGVKPRVDTVYQVLHERIRAKDEVSFKLLSLVPLISGVGISILIRADIAWGLTCFVSAFGATVTFGIFRWELRNIQWCDELMKRADALEHVTMPDAPLLRVGIRNERSVGKTEAELILYLAVILAWLFLPSVDAFIGPKEQPGVLEGLVALFIGLALGMWVVMTSKPAGKRPFRKRGVSSDH